MTFQELKDYLNDVEESALNQDVRVLMDNELHPLEVCMTKSLMFLVPEFTEE